MVLGGEDYFLYDDDDVCGDWDGDESIEDVIECVVGYGGDDYESFGDGDGVVYDVW